MVLMHILQSAINAHGHQRAPEVIVAGRGIGGQALFKVSVDIDYSFAALNLFHAVAIAILPVVSRGAVYKTGNLKPGLAIR